MRRAGAEVASGIQRPSGEGSTDLGGTAAGRTRSAGGLSDVATWSGAEQREGGEAQELWRGGCGRKWGWVSG